jgi:hypothetical protein
LEEEGLKNREKNGQKLFSPISKGNLNLKIGRKREKGFPLWRYGNWKRGENLKQKTGEVVNKSVSPHSFTFSLCPSGFESLEKWKNKELEV